MGVEASEKEKEEGKGDSLSEPSAKQPLKKKATGGIVRSLAKRETRKKYADILKRVQEQAPCDRARDCIDKICTRATADMLLVLAKDK